MPTTTPTPKETTGLSASFGEATPEPPWSLFANRLLMVAAIAATAGGACLRVFHLNAIGFNSDETVYAGQAASIAGNAALKPFFPIFRAHPMLFQTALSLAYLGGASDLTARIFA